MQDLERWLGHLPLAIDQAKMHIGKDEEYMLVKEAMNCPLRLYLSLVMLGEEFSRIHCPSRPKF
jgi:hypothetical protein